MHSLALLGSYSSSDSEEEPPAEHLKPRLPVPMLPSFQVCKSITREPVLGDIAHQNRIRTFTHEPGNWATYIHIPIEENFELSDYLEYLIQMLPTCGLKLVDDFHVSLTRTVVLRYHWIENFVKAVKLCLDDIKTFTLSFSGLKVYTNEEKTRTFIGLEACQGVNDLNVIVKYLDKCLTEYNLPTFYDSPSFHFSVLWCIGDCYIHLNNVIKNLPEKIQQYSHGIEVSHCVCKTGNKQFNFALGQKTQ